MFKRNLVLVLVFSLLLVTTSGAAALQQAEVSRGLSSLAYGIQTLNGELIALNLHSDIGFSQNFGLEGMLTYYNQDAQTDEWIADVNAKLNFVQETDTNVTGLVGIHTQVDNGFDSVWPRVGVLVSQSQTSSLDFNTGIDFLLEKDSNYIGYMLGFDYMLTRNLHMEVEHRRFSGQSKTEGLNIAFRQYF